LPSRRQFLSTSIALGAIAASRRVAAKTATCASDCSITELNQRIARRDFRGITRDMLPTPCLLVDLDLVDANIQHLATTAKTNGIHVRPHVKVHKSIEVAQRQISAGAIGLTCSTIAEAELFSNAGMKGMIWTKQPVGKNNTQRAIALSKKDPSFMFVSDDTQVLDWVEEAAQANNAKVRVLVSVYAGLDRQGIAAGKPALDLAKKVDASRHMHFEGFMAYSGNAAHVHGFEARKKASMEILAGVRECKSLALQAGLPVNIMTGGSTGTYNIDHATGLSELQAATYVFMDTAYLPIGGQDDPSRYTDFKPALAVLTTVDSQYHPNLISTDYGAKAMAHSSDLVKQMPWLKVGNGGAEYGALTWKDGEQHPKLGDQLEIYPTSLDITTAAFDRYYVARGENIVDVWPIMGRAGAPQR
jgi:D-serine deaminase-like pyridoxal phosphate-dependent protein